LWFLLRKEVHFSAHANEFIDLAEPADDGGIVPDQEIIGDAFIAPKSIEGTLPTQCFDLLNCGLGEVVVAAAVKRLEGLGDLVGEEFGKAETRESDEGKTKLLERDLPATDGSSLVTASMSSRACCSSLSLSSGNDGSRSFIDLLSRAQARC
jgi:hypothetical protein